MLNTYKPAAPYKLGLSEYILRIFLFLFFTPIGILLLYTSVRDIVRYHQLVPHQVIVQTRIPTSCSGTYSSGAGLGNDYIVGDIKTHQGYKVLCSTQNLTSGEQTTVYALPGSSNAYSEKFDLANVNVYGIFIGLFCTSIAVLVLYTTIKKQIL